MGKADDDFDEFWGKVSGDESPDSDLDKRKRDKIIDLARIVCSGDLEDTARYLEWAFRSLPDWLDDSGRTGKQRLTFQKGIKEMSKDDLEDGLCLFLSELQRRGVNVKVRRIEE